MSGYVGQIKGLGSDPNGIQFLLSRSTGQERIFKSRESALHYLKTIERLSKDDLRFIFWFEEGEDLKRNILTGELISPPPSEVSYEDVEEALNDDIENGEDEDEPDDSDYPDQEMFEDDNEDEDE